MRDAAARGQPRPRSPHWSSARAPAPSVPAAAPTASASFTRHGTTGHWPLRGALDVTVKPAVSHIVDAAPRTAHEDRAAAQTPAVKCQPGQPPAATHNAVSVGHSNSNQPAGRFQRMRSRSRRPNAHANPLRLSARYPLAMRHQQVAAWRRKGNQREKRGANGSGKTTRHGEHNSNQKPMTT
jgi:hypothetical protein